jgi:hypothetical protein
MNIEQTLLEIRSRNEERLRDAIAKMGTKYLLHPANRVKKVVSLKKGKRK